MEKFRRRFSGVLDLRRPLYFLADFYIADQVHVSVSHALRIFVELAQRVIEISRKDVAFFVVLIKGAIALRVRHLTQPLFNRSHQALRDQKRNITLESLVHRSILHRSEPGIWTMERGDDSHGR